MTKRVLLAKPRGYCAGVDRAVVTVEKALEAHGAPVYVRKEIVHNRHVVETLQGRGVVFVDEADEVPAGAVVVFSAHGVSPAVHEQAAIRGLRTIDATCPLVTKVHQEVKRFARDGYDILLIGHQGHEEVEGTAGEAPRHVQLVDGPDAVDSLTVRDSSRVVWLSQTTLSVDETMQTVARLRQRFPEQAIVVATIVNGSSHTYFPPREVYGTGIYQDTVALLAPGSLERLTEEIAGQIAAWNS